MSCPLRPSLIPNLNPDSCPTMITIPADNFLDQSVFESHVLDAIQHASKPQVLTFSEVSLSWGEKTFDSINAEKDGFSTRKSYNSLKKVLRVTIMPTELHDCCQDWWRLAELSLRQSGDLTFDEQTQIMTRVGTTLEFASGPYRQSRKEPDLFVRQMNRALPSFVMESGFSESWDDLMDDMNLLLVGGNGEISAVVILKWRLNSRTSRVSGFVELYVRDRNGMPVLRQREDVFPIPPQTPTPQRLELTRQEVFGAGLVPDPTRNGPPNAMVFLEIDLLRLVAAHALLQMNLHHA